MGQKVSLGTVSRALSEKSSLYNGHLGLVGLVIVSLPTHISLNPVFPGGNPSLLSQQARILPQRWRRQTIR